MSRRELYVTGGFARFQRSSVQVDGRWQMMIVARCSHKGCGFQERINDNTREGMNTGMAMAKFRQRGWRLGTANAAGNSDLCPRCVRLGRRPAKEPKAAASAGYTAPKPAKPTILSPAQKRAAWCHIAGVPRAAPKEITMPAAQPRQPTVSDRRKIMEELEARYDIANERYIAAFSDEALASSLDVPRAWITEVRCQFFGIGAGCAADLEYDADLDALEARVAGALELLGTIDADLRRLKEGRALKRKTS